MLVATRACLGLAVAAAVAGPAGLVLILGPHAAPFWAVSAALLAVTLILWLTGGRRRGRTSGTSRTSRTVLTVVAVLTTVWVLGSAALDLPGTRYLVATPAGPGGCRVAVAESAFLFAGGGRIYAGSVIGHQIGRYTADDGGRPISERSYQLSWDADGTGVLQLLGTDGNPVYPGLFEANC